MSKKLIFGLILSFICVFGVRYDAYAWDSGNNWSSENCYFISGANGDPGMPEHCRSDSNDKITISPYEQDLYNTMSFNTCDECVNGYRIEQKSDWLTYNGYGCDVTYNICVPECPNYVDCPDGYKDGGSTFDSCTTTKENSCYQTCSEKCSGNDTASCPAHATCSYNTGSSTSGRKYYGSSSCSASAGKCPVSTITCDAGYYKKGNSCTQCPLADGIYTNSTRTSAYQARYTSTAGTTSVNDCYLPSGTTYYDAKGTFTFDTTCNY